MDVDSDEDPSIERTRIDERDIRDDEADGTAGPTGAWWGDHGNAHGALFIPISPASGEEVNRAPPFEHDGGPAVENDNPLI